MQWMKVNLSQDDVASGKIMQIQEAFAAIFISAGGPPEAAMFGRSRVDAALLGDGFDADADGDNGYQTLYFSPAAAQLAQKLIFQYGGILCDQPGRSALLVGD